MSDRPSWWSRLFARDEGAPIAPEEPASAQPEPAPPPAPPFVAENELELLLSEASANQGARPAFHAALLDAPLLVMTPNAPAQAGARTLTSDETLTIVNVPAPDGRSVPALFSSEARLRDFAGAGAHYVAMRGRDILGIVAADGAWLNPGAAYGVYWTGDDLHAMLGRPLRRTVEKDTRVLLGAPAERPERLIAALTDALAADPRVGAAWLALAHWPDAGPDATTSSWYLDLRADHDADAITPGLGPVLRPELLEGRPVDIRVAPVGEAPGAGIRLKPAALH